MSGMRVLHFVPSLAGAFSPPATGYKAALFEAMARLAVVRVLALRGPAAAMAGVEVRVGRSCAPWRLRRFFAGELAGFRPDVVHIHACWSLSAYVLSEECRRLGVAVVITTDRRMEEWHVRRRYWLAGLPRLLLYQRRMLRRAGALHFVCAQEQARFSSFGWHPSLKASAPLNDRSAVIEPCGVEPGMTPQGMSLRLLSLYRKVADSRPFARMDSAMLRAEDALLRLGLWHHTTGGRALAADDDARLARGLAPWQLRLVCLHAYDEGILGHVACGVKAAGMDMPFGDAAAVDRFPLRRASAARPVPYPAGGGAEPASRVLALCEGMAGLLRAVSRGTARRADFARMCLELRAGGYDEDALCRLLARRRLLGGARRLLQLMEERYGLGEGYMFADPVDDRTTAALRRKLYKSDTQ